MTIQYSVKPLSLNFIRYFISTFFFLTANFLFAQNELLAPLTPTPNITPGVDYYGSYEAYTNFNEACSKGVTAANEHRWKDSLDAFNEAKAYVVTDQDESYVEKWINYVQIKLDISFYNNPLAPRDSLSKPVTTPSPGPSATETASSKKVSKPIDHEISFSPLIAIPISSNTASQFNPGLGGEVAVDFQPPGNISFGFMFIYQDCPVNISSINNNLQQTYGMTLPSEVSLSGDLDSLMILPRIKYYFENGNVRPYFILAGGIAYTSVAASIGYMGQSINITTGETDVVLFPGLGLDIPAGNDIFIFTQISLMAIFTSNSNTDPVVITGTGVNGTAKSSLTGDSPTLFIPIEIGVRFGQR